MAQLPKESDSQQIGHEAVQAFYSNKPRNWRCNPLDGDADVGYDISVQVTENGHFVGMFHVQVKGSKQSINDVNASLSSDGNFFSVSLKISTLNYFIINNFDIFLVFVDLTIDPFKPANCPVYFLYVNDELDNLRGDKSNLDHLDKNQHTFHVPVNNLLNDKADILGIIKKRQRKQLTLDNLYFNISNQTDNPDKTIADLNAKIKHNPHLLNTFQAETDTPWIDALEGSIASKLRQINNCLNQYSTVEAEHELNILSERYENATEHEKAEYNYQRGRLYTQMYDNEKALNSFIAAYELAKDKQRYRLAYLEYKINNQLYDETSLSNMIEEIKVFSDPKCIHLKCKMLALQEDFNTVFDLLSKCPEKEIVILKCVIYLMQNSFEQCVDYIDKNIIMEGLSRKTIFKLRILKARALFQIGIVDVQDGETIPFSGKPGMDADSLLSAWRELSDVLEADPMISYPIIADVALDMFVILSMYFEEYEAAKYHLTTMSSLQPYNINLHEGIVNVALHLDDHDLAEKHISFLPDTLDKVVHSIFISYRKNNRKQVIVQAIDILDPLIKTKPLNYEPALAMALESSEHLMQQDDYNVIKNAINTLPNSVELLTLKDILRDSKSPNVSRDEIINRLYSLYKKGHKSYQTLANLFQKLNPHKIDSALILIMVYHDLSLYIELNKRDHSSLLQAYYTTKKFNELLKCALNCQKRYPHDTIFWSFEAMALDELGHTKKAMDLLEQRLNNDNYDNVALGVYINIASRNGLLSKVHELINRFYERTTDRSDKSILLNLLFSVEYNLNPQSNHLQKVAESLGRLVNQNNELEEGPFLVTVFISTLNSTSIFTECFIKEFQDRLQNFTKKFPHSNILTSIPFELDNIEDFLKRLNKVTGFTEEKRQWYQKCENLLKNSDFPVPYIVRPNVLLNISHFIHLWGCSKIFGSSYPQYLLDISPLNDESNDILDLGKPVLIDETAILLLHELELLPFLFELFSTIIICKKTMFSFQKIGQSIPPTPYAATAREIIQSLGLYLNQLQQPSTLIEINLDNAFGPLDAIKSLYNPYEHTLYADDFLTRIYITESNSGNKTLNTMKFVNFLKNQDFISGKTAALMVAKLCTFNVKGLSIPFKYFLYPLQESTPSNVSYSYMSYLLDNCTSFNTFLNYVCNPDRKSGSSQADLVNFLKFMIVAEHGVQVEFNVILAIWVKWLNKLLLSHSAEVSQASIILQIFFQVSLNIINFAVLKRLDPTIFIRTAWSLFQKILEITYGNDMDRSIEDESLVTLAQIIVDWEKNNNTSIFNYFYSPLTPGTAYAQTLHDKYIQLVANSAKQ